jgi:hypothetical protein
MAICQTSVVSAKPKFDTGGQPTAEKGVGCNMYSAAMRPAVWMPLMRIMSHVLFPDPNEIKLYLSPEIYFVSEIFGPNYFGMINRLGLSGNRSALPVLNLA